MIYKVTLKLYLPEYEGGPWIDGPVQYMDSQTLEKFSQEHSYFKVETARPTDLPFVLSPFEGVREGMKKILKEKADERYGR